MVHQIDIEFSCIPLLVIPVFRGEYGGRYDMCVLWSCFALIIRFFVLPLHCDKEKKDLTSYLALIHDKAFMKFTYISLWFDFLMMKVKGSLIAFFAVPCI